MRPDRRFIITKLYSTPLFNVPEYSYGRLDGSPVSNNLLRRTGSTSASRMLLLLKAGTPLDAYDTILIPQEYTSIMRPDSRSKRLVFHHTCTWFKCTSRHCRLLLIYSTTLIIITPHIVIIDYIGVPTDPQYSKCTIIKQSYLLMYIVHINISYELLPIQYSSIMRLYRRHLSIVHGVECTRVP